MSSKRVNRWRRACHSGLLAIAILALSAGPGQTAEPFGHVRIEAAWVEEDPSTPTPDHRTLRVDLQPLVSVDDVKLTVRSPRELRLRALSAAGDELRPVPSAARLMVVQTGFGSLSAGASRKLEFEVEVPSVGDAVIAFVVEGVGPSGKPFREALGFSAGGGAASGVLRLGAMEFPAAVLTDGGDR